MRLQTLLRERFSHDSVDAPVPGSPAVADGAAGGPGPAGRLARELRNASLDPSEQRRDGFGVMAAVGANLSHDRVASFNGAILIIRFATTITSILLASPMFVDRSVSIIAWSAGLIGYTIFRALSPIRYTGDIQSLLRVVAEVGIHVGAVIATGYWESPFVFSLLTAVIVAGFGRGFAFALRISIVSALAINIPWLTRPSAGPEEFQVAAQWTGMLLLVALVAGYGRRISGEANRQHSIALDRLGRLADANALLFSLHRVAQTLPASLDLDEVLETTLGRLRSLFEFDGAAILLFDETDGQWLVARQEGMRIPQRLGPTELPPGLRRAIAESGLVSVPSLRGAEAPGLRERSESGLYTVLPARGSILGLLAVEHNEAQHFTGREEELLNGFTEPVALAVDNARWFGRLRTVGADEERTRIARDLHDRIGQSLAYLAFELDRIISKDEKQEPISSSLLQLREDVRGVVREVRDTLYDLRTDVSEKQGFAEVIEQFVQRVSERTNLNVRLHADRSTRLPLLQEREMWRIAQEALTNIERHAEASEVRVVWRCDGERAALEIIDDGKGFAPGKAGRMDSYGMMGMRERAGSVGASLEVQTAPGKGTRVLCVLNAVSG